MKADKTDVKRAVSAPEVLQHFGVEVRRNYCRCFAHNGENFKMKIFDDGVVCMSECHATLDIFGITMHFMQCDFTSALDYICDVWRIPNESEPIPEFDRLRHDIKRMTGELARMELGGWEAGMRNALAVDAGSVEVFDLAGMREEYRGKLAMLDRAKKKLRSGKFEEEICKFMGSDTIKRLTNISASGTIRQR